MSDIPRRPRTPNTGPKLLRDATGKLDQDDAKRVNEELLAKFLKESAHIDKENTFHVSRTGKRDLVVHLAVTILPQVDGHIVAGEQEREMGQWCFRLNSNQLPVKNATVIRALSELAHIGKQVLMKMGVVIP